MTNACVGKIFGELTILREVLPKKRNTRMWLCKCVCGNEKIVQGGNLVTGHTKSCGDSVHKVGIALTHGASSKHINNKSTRKKYHALFSSSNRIGCAANEMAEWIINNPAIEGYQLVAKDPRLKITPDNAIYRTVKEVAENTTKSKWWFIAGKKYTSSYEAAKANNVSRATIERWCKKRVDCFSEFKYPK